MINTRRRLSVGRVPSFETLRKVQPVARASPLSASAPWIYVLVTHRERDTFARVHAHFNSRPVCYYTFVLSLSLSLSFFGEVRDTQKCVEDWKSRNRKRRGRVMKNVTMAGSHATRRGNAVERNL